MFMKRRALELVLGNFYTGSAALITSTQFVILEMQLCW